MRGNSDEVRSINSYLDILDGKVYDYQKEVLHEGLPVTTAYMRNELLGVEDKKRSLVKIFQEHNNQVEALIGDEFAPGTLERYKTSLKHTVDFIKWKFNIPDIDTRRIDYAFITEYEFYLRSFRKCNNCNIN